MGTEGKRYSKRDRERRGKKENGWKIRGAKVKERKRRG